MRLKVGYVIHNDRGKKGIITELDYKNGQRVVSFDGIEGSLDGRSYKEQILSMFKTDGILVYSNEKKGGVK